MAGASSEGGDIEAPPLIGKKVVVSGLLARPELNNLVGEATGFDATKGRYTVLVNAEVLSLKPANLTAQKCNDGDATAFAPWTRIRIKGLVAKPELNECGGSVVEWNPEKERYIVQLDGSLKTMLLRAQNLERDRRERCACGRVNTGSFTRISVSAPPCLPAVAYRSRTTRTGRWTPCRGAGDAYTTEPGAHTAGDGPLYPRAGRERQPLRVNGSDRRY